MAVSGAFGVWNFLGLRRGNGCSCLRIRFGNCNFQSLSRLDVTIHK